MELLRVLVNVTKTLAVESGERAVRMVLFNGRCDGPLFQGEILEGGVDTQIEEGDTRLSARYMLKGKDHTGQACSLFIENNAVAKKGELPETKPIIYTDSQALKWLENATLHGKISEEEDRLVIHIYGEE